MASCDNGGEYQDGIPVYVWRALHDHGGDDWPRLVQVIRLTWFSGDWRGRGVRPVREVAAEMGIHFVRVAELRRRAMRVLALVVASEP